MKQLFLAAGALALLLPACQPTEKADKEPIIGKHQLELKSDVMTPEVLWSYGRLGGAEVSPDGKTVLYGVSYYDIPENKSNTDLFTVPVAGGDSRQLTNTSFGEYGAVWRPDGKKIAFISSESGNMQVWEMNPNGKGKKQLTKVEGNITNFAFAPSGDRVFYTMDVKVDPTVADQYPDLDKADGRLINDLMYRHWDTWEDGHYSHLFIAEYQNGQLSNHKDLMKGEAYDCPLLPFGGIEQINWRPDGKEIAYSCKKLSGKAYTLSTNSDVYTYNIETGKTINITEGMPGYDWNPVYSPDGKKLLWTSMERAGFEADKERLFLLDFETGEKTYLTRHFDHSPASIQWTPDGKSIYFVAGVFGTFQLHKMDIETTKITPITSGQHDYHGVAQAGDQLIATRVSMSKPQEIYRVDPTNGKATEISFENKHLLDQITMGKVEKRYVKTTDNQDMLTWVIYPPHFDPSKKYPTILYCEGGPQSPLSQFWSYRWNFQMMAANGYIIVAPNRRGVLTMGQEWTDQISKDNGGQCMKDYLSAIDALAREPYVDEDNLGAIGASFGGFSVYWLAGNHEKRFKAFIAHCGVFNSEMEYATTDEMFFDNWEKGGAYWETNNPVAMKSYASSPHKFVKNWDTPILVIHGEKDFRIPYTQGMAAFNSAQLQGIPSQFLIFPNENHWVLSPQNGILWQRTFKNWLDKWLKE